MCKAAVSVNFAFTCLTVVYVIQKAAFCNASFLRSSPVFNAGLENLCGLIVWLGRFRAMCYMAARWRRNPVIYPPVLALVNGLASTWRN